MTDKTTTTTIPALLPCPMCDAPASFGRVTYDPRTVREQEWTQDTFHYVNCPACGVKNLNVVGFKTQEDASAAWNRRAATRVGEVVEALKEVMEWINNWSPPFTDDDEWPATKAKVDAALRSGEGR